MCHILAMLRNNSVVSKVQMFADFFLRLMKDVCLFADPVLAQGPPPNPNEYMQVLHHEHTNQAESSSLQRQPLSSGHSSGGTVSLMMPRELLLSVPLRT